MKKETKFFLDRVSHSFCEIRMRCLLKIYKQVVTLRTTRKTFCFC
ncbi:unnamed protein product [Amoebophrya sp. A120]|nr:unnamed protein product [Amoebophrya sp. A120]|eukprot:GSA120T00019078001.1